MGRNALYYLILTTASSCAKRARTAWGGDGQAACDRLPWREILSKDLGALQTEREARGRPSEGSVPGAVEGRQGRQGAKARWTQPQEGTRQTDVARWTC